MAEAAILSAVKNLGDLAIQKAGFLKGVEGQVKWLKDELERMQCFLKDAAEKQTNDERIRKWISDIREVAHDADDVIETFILKVDTPRRSTGLLGRWLYLPNHVYHLNRVGKTIESIRARLQDIEKSREGYGIQNLGEGMVLSRRPEDVEWRRRLSPWQQDKHVVGLEEDVELLLRNAILEERKGLSIASIVGMGGIGKSTLARKVYNHAAVAARFDRRAWVCVSSEFSPKEIMKELMLQLLDPTEDKLRVLETMEKLQLPSLQQMLQERLQGRRYFIVLDDVWEDAHWESIASAFPDQDETSRLLLTSRNRLITKYAPYVHEMKLLDPNVSWELLLKKAFIDNTDGKCPEELENIGREILKKCDGLPLAITVVGGLLVDKSPSKSKWEKVLKEIKSHHLGRIESSVSAILELSYHNLPPQLKSCFLCLGFFKEDATIRATKLVQVWIAEGFVPQEGGEETMADVARSYLDELINRNMVQVKDMSKDGRVKNCHVHDLLRELSIKKAKEEISFEILREEGNSQSLDKPRHRAVYCSKEKFIYSANPNKHLRSLFFHGAGNIDGSPSYWKSFELLRVLDFEDFGLKFLPSTIGGLIGLRYLGLRNNYIEELPSSLGRLKNLEVLDISRNIILDVEVPNVIWKMDRLRHLYMSDITCKTPLKIDTLKNLQTLTYIPADNWTPEHLTGMTSLCKLGIKLDLDSDVSKLCNSLVVLENLVCLKLRDTICSRMDGFGILHRVTQLKLDGVTELPSINDFPPNLSYLTLGYIIPRQDPMSLLKKLPKLLYLKLDFVHPGHGMMILPYDGFPKLKVLYLRSMYLNSIYVAEGAMPELKRLKIYGCPYLERLKYVGKGGMSELKRLEIYECPNLERLPEEVRLTSNLQRVEDGDNHRNGI